MSKVIRTRLSEQIETDILTQIKQRVHLDGDLLPSERDLMETYGVGRPSVREALFSLESKGFLRLSRGTRPVVKTPSYEALLNNLHEVLPIVVQNNDDWLNFYELRIALELYIALKLCETGLTEEQRKSIQHILDEMAKSLDSVDDYLTLDLAFHNTLADAMDNPILVALYKSILKWGMQNKRDLQRSLNIKKTNQPKTQAEHVEIFRAICDRSYDDVRRIILMTFELDDEVNIREPNDED
ncbi:MAG: FadR/GntR family transcriptional regulator [Vibrio sp.]|uniref:FadR/GntR family transcriptional regulator n=1 Tax=Vibrio sp. TaxID=678 RepID=UPI003A870BA4